MHFSHLDQTFFSFFSIPLSHFSKCATAAIIAFVWVTHIHAHTDMRRRHFSLSLSSSSGRQQASHHTHTHTRWHFQISTFANIEIEEICQNFLFAYCGSRFSMMITFQFCYWRFLTIAKIPNHWKKSRTLYLSYSLFLHIFFCTFCGSFPFNN